MCTQTEPAVPSSTAQALAMVRAGLGYIASCDAASLGTPVLAEALIGLEQAEAQHTAARAKMLAAFSAQQGHHADGQYGPAAWLRAFTRVTNGAATGAVKWARRLAAHPALADALAAGQLSVSWARALCEWTDRLPEDRRGDADAILLAAVLGGAGLADLAALAEQMIERSRSTPDRDKDRFDDRAVWLETTIGGAGRLTGDLTGPAAAAVTAVLAALGARGGPEDTRSLIQRQHDALHEACQRLIESGMLPGDGSSQPVQVSVHVDLAELRGLSGASELERGWTTARAAAAGIPGSVYLTGPEAEAAACDAALVPVVSGHIDWAALDQLTALYLDTTRHRHDPGAGTGQDAGPDGNQDTAPDTGPDGNQDTAPDTGPDGSRTAPGRDPDGSQAAPGRTRTGATAPGRTRTCSIRRPANGSSTPCSSGASTFCPGRRDSRPTCGATCCPPGSPACPSRWTSAAPPGSSPPTCVKP